MINVSSSIVVKKGVQILRNLSVAIMPPIDIMLAMKLCKILKEINLHFRIAIDELRKIVPSADIVVK
jgi:hypothetical protein